ncbi:hypothetical protein FB451DRAFT_792149 [Mycena latifolia]|nr:hypothetical protein FB451DRAFT_792149 [Mycena latifolia]
MAFSFLSSDFFKISDDITPAPRAQTTPHDTLPTLPATDSTPSSSEAFNTFVSSSSPCDAPTFSDPSPDRYIPKAFVYNTPINSGVFGSVYDSGYSALSSRTAHYHLPGTPTTSSHRAPPPVTSTTPGETHFEQYEAGELKTRRGRGDVWELNCSLCDHWIRTSVPTRRPLSIPNHFANLESHQQSNKCLKAHRAFTAPPVISPRKKNSSMASPRNDESDDDEDDGVQQGRSSSLPPEALRNPSPTVSPMIIVQTCPGSQLDWPVEVGPFNEMFPFHRIGVTPGSLPFVVEIHNRGTTVIAFSKTCTQEARLGGCCSHCARIPAEVQKLVDQAVQADSRTNFRYLNWAQIQSLLADRTEEVRRWRLKGLNYARNLASAMRKLRTTSASWMRWQK